MCGSLAFTEDNIVLSSFSFPSIVMHERITLLQEHFKFLFVMYYVRFVCANRQIYSLSGVKIKAF